MREINFRYYDPKYNMMCHCDSPSVFIGMEGGAYEKVEKSGFGTRWDEYEKEESYILLQYTGLKDRNGTEIYEGDILKIPVDFVDSIHGNFSFNEVVYRNGTWITQYLKSETGFKLPRGYTAGQLIDHFDHDMKMLVFTDGRLKETDIEIIGNIYENKNLLEDSK